MTERILRVKRGNDDPGQILRVKRLDAGAVLPVREEGSIGYDLFSNEYTVVPAKGKALIGTGIAVAIPMGHYGRIAPRSSVGWKFHTDIGCGVVDPSYTGEIKVVIFNHAEEDFVVEKGLKIAQLILERASTFPIEEVEELDETNRGEGGFGSTGMYAPNILG